MLNVACTPDCTPVAHFTMHRAHTSNSGLDIPDATHPALYVCSREGAHTSACSGWKRQAHAICHIFCFKHVCCCVAYAYSSVFSGRRERCWAGNSRAHTHTMCSISLHFIYLYYILPHFCCVLLHCAPFSQLMCACGSLKPAGLSYSSCHHCTHVATPSCVAFRGCTLHTTPQKEGGIRAACHLPVAKSFTSAHIAPSAIRVRLTRYFLNTHWTFVLMRCMNCIFVHLFAGGRCAWRRAAPVAAGDMTFLIPACL